MYIISAIKMMLLKSQRTLDAACEKNSSTATCKIIGNQATVFNDFSVVNWYKNPLKSVARFPIILQIAVLRFAK
jgi:hypothetical protein